MSKQDIIDGLRKHIVELEETLYQWHTWSNQYEALAASRLELLEEVKKLLVQIKRATYYREGVRQYRPKINMNDLDELYDKLAEEIGE